MFGSGIPFALASEHGTVNEGAEGSSSRARGDGAGSSSSSELHEGTRDVPLVLGGREETDTGANEANQNTVGSDDSGSHSSTVARLLGCDRPTARMEYIPCRRRASVSVPCFFCRARPIVFLLKSNGSYRTHCTVFYSTHDYSTVLFVETQQAFFLA